MCGKIGVATLACLLAGCLAPEVPETAGGGGGVPPAVLAPASGEADCVVIVDAEPEVGGPPLTVHFHTEVDCTAAPVTYSWDFGDGGKGSSAAHPSHTYEKEGEYVAVVRIAAPDGASSDDTIDIVVDASFDE